MSVSDIGVVSPAISVKEISDLLQVPSLDVATLCSSDKVNMWSPRRPIASSYLGILDDEMRKNANWGYKIKTWNRRDSIEANISCSWKSEGVGPVYRLTDFNGYQHNAAKFLPTLVNQTINKALGFPYTIEMNTELAGNVNFESLGISFSTLNGVIPLSEFKLGIVLWQQGTTAPKYYFINDTPGLFRSISLGSNLNFNPADNSIWYGIIFAAYETDTSVPVVGSDLYVSLSQTSLATIKFITNNGYSVVANGEINSDYYIKGTVVFKNTSNNELKFTGCTVFCNSTNTPTGGSLLGGAILDDITLKPNSAASVNFALYASKADTYWLSVRGQIFDAPGHSGTTISFNSDYYQVLQHFQFS